MKFVVNYSVDVNYEIEIEADSEEEAEDLVNDGAYDDEDAVWCGEEFLHVNSVLGRRII